MEPSVNQTKKIVPSLPATSYEELIRLFNTLEGVADEIQVDIVDGQFAPFVSWPFTETDVETALRNMALYKDIFQLEVDCMIMNPERLLDLFVEVGFRRVVVHLRSTEKYDEIISHARTHGYAIGFATVNHIPLEELEQHIEKINFVQLMGIKEIGQQGQPFDKRTLVRAKELRSKYPELEIAVDGSVNKDTIGPLLEAGVNRFAPGSAVAKTPDPARAFRELESLIS